jgi:hypothetical protein
MDAEIVVNSISAIGTLGAVFVALHLSGKTENHREAKEARLQRMHSLYLLPILEGLWSDLLLSSVWVHFAEENPKSMDDVAERLSRAKKWATDFESHLTLGPLSAESLLMLPEIVGHRLSRALGILHALRIEILRFNPDEWSNSVQAITSKSKEWADNQGMAKDFIFVAIQELKDKANSEALYPSGEELHGERD